MEESLPVIQFTHRDTGEVRVGHFHPPSTKLPSEWTDGYGERVEAPEDITDWLAGGAGSGGGGGGGGDIQDLLDGISTTRGSLLYRDSADWDDLAPGIEGAPLVSGGAGANPVWGLGVENVIKTCKNDTGTNITKGTPVKVTGVHGELPKIEVATASNTHVPSGSGSNEIFGIAATTINHNAAGPVLIQGTLTGLDTSAYTSGNFLYVPTSGTTLTATPPAVPYDRICIALVTKVDATDGQICVRTPQPVHLNDITGFNVGTLTEGDIIQYDSATNTFVNAAPSGGGSNNLWIPASAWIPRTSNGCGVDSRETSTNKQNFDELLFDAAADEFAQALVLLPSNYAGGTVTARFYWTAASGSGDVVWGIQGRAFADDDALDTAHGTAQTATDTLLAANDMHVSSATSATTIGGTPAANRPVQFQIYRDADADGDTLAVDARLLGVEIIFA